MGERSQPKARRWTLLVSVLLLMVLAGMVGGIIGHQLPASNSQLKNQMFSTDVVLSDKGLTFKDKDGRVIAKLNSGQRGGFLIIYNASEQPAMSIGASVDGGGLIGLTNGKGVGDILRLAGYADGATLFLVSPTGKRGIVLSTDADGGTLSVNSPTGDEAVTIDTEDSGSVINGRIEVLESRSGKLLWTSPTGTRTKR